MGMTNEMRIALPEPASILVHYDIPGDEAEASMHYQMLCGEGTDDFRKAVKLDICSPKVANGRVLAITNLTPGSYRFERLKRLAIGEPASPPDSNAGRAAIRSE